MKPPTTLGELMNVPPFDVSRMMDIHLNNLATITRIWLVAANGVAAIALKQHEIAVTALTDMTEITRSYQPGSDPQKAMAGQGEFANKAMEATIANMCEIAGLMQNSGTEAFSVVRESIVAQVSDWLSDPANSAMLANFVLRKLPPILAAIDRSSLPSLIGEQVRMELENVEIAPLAAGLLSAAVEKGRHQYLLDELLNALEALMSNSPALETVRQRIRAQLPAVLNLYRGEPVIMNKIIDSAMALISEIRADPAHPVRVELDSYLSELISRLRNSPELASRVETLKRDLLDRPELADLAAGRWDDLRDFLVRDARSKESLLRGQLEAMLNGAGGQRAPQPVDHA
jgi:phasin family protein